jgi:hypothetical protein
MVNAWIDVDMIWVYESGCGAISKIPEIGKET